MFTAKVQKRDKTGQLTITIPKDFAYIKKIDRGTVFEFVVDDNEYNAASGDIILRREQL